MTRIPRWIILVMGVANVLTGVFIFAMPTAFYEGIPGLGLMGPFSVHFIRDVGLAYFSGGFVLVAGGMLRDWRLALSGALWLALHAIFHLQIWSHRGFPFDGIFWFDFYAVLSPATATVWAAFQLRKKPA